MRGDQIDQQQPAQQPAARKDGQLAPAQRHPNHKRADVAAHHLPDAETRLSQSCHEHQHHRQRQKHDGEAQRTQKPKRTQIHWLRNSADSRTSRSAGFCAAVSASSPVILKNHVSPGAGTIAPMTRCFLSAGACSLAKIDDHKVTPGQGPSFDYRLEVLRIDSFETKLSTPAVDVRKQPARLALKARHRNIHLRPVCSLDDKAGFPHRRRRLSLPTRRGLQTDCGGVSRILRLLDLFAHRRFLRECFLGASYSRTSARSQLTTNAGSVSTRNLFISSRSYCDARPSPLPNPSRGITYLWSAHTCRSKGSTGFGVIC